jgi:hypothetical protein
MTNILQPSFKIFPYGAGAKTSMPELVFIFSFYFLSIMLSRKKRPEISTELDLVKFDLYSGEAIIKYRNFVELYFLS